MISQKPQEYRENLNSFTNYIYAIIGVLFLVLPILIICVSLIKLVLCFLNSCEFMDSLLDSVSFLIISLAIFDVGRYLLEEQVLRDRELRAPEEARKSITKFMVIIVIAVMLEGLLLVQRVGEADLTHLVYPSGLLVCGVFLLIGLGLYQRLSAETEREVEKIEKEKSCDE